MQQEDDDIDHVHTHKNTTAAKMTTDQTNITKYIIMKREDTKKLKDMVFVYLSTWLFFLLLLSVQIPLADAVAVAVAVERLSCTLAVAMVMATEMIDC